MDNKERESKHKGNSKNFFFKVMEHYMLVVLDECLMWTFASSLWIQSASSMTVCNDLLSPICLTSNLFNSHGLLMGL